jgi:hypothetical protein
MSSSSKSGWRAWTQGLSVLARSPICVLALAAFIGLWCFAGFEWLWLPESSGWVLGLALVWILALVALAVAAVCGTVSNVSAVASGAEKHLSLRRILSIERIGRTALVALAVLAGVLVLDAVFGWIDDHAVFIASFLTFHFQHPVSYIVIGKFLWVIEAIIWITVAGVFMNWLLLFSRPRSFAPMQSAPRPTRLLGVMTFVTGILSAGVFGSLAWLLATWHLIVKPGGWDYAQLAIRNGAALLLVTIGWLFWSLTLARVTISPLTEPASSPPRS